MASAGARAPSPRLARAHRLARARRACLLVAVALSVAGCVGMPQGGQVGAFSNKQAGAEQNPESEIGLFPSGPQPNSSPAGIVKEFLTASASYPTDAPIVQEYLAGSAKAWDPGWSVTVLNSYAVTSLGTPQVGRQSSDRALVEVSGQVQATLNGTGQYVLASAQGGSATQTYLFNLVKVGGQWRISNPPRTYRLVTSYDFPKVYQAQDLYFFASTGADAQNHVLVPDPVFVPTGTSPEPLVSQLVTALAQGPNTGWLQGAAASAFPLGTKVLGVLLSGATVTVNLGGTAVSASTPTLERISAELLWTLAGPTASIQTIQSVELELDGHAWSPTSSPCATGQAPTAFQKLASYECYDPYPSVPASFSYLAQGQPWSRCGSESEAQGGGSIGSVLSVFGRTGSATSQQCGGYVDPQLPVLYPRVALTPALSMAAVSPNGEYVAGVSPAPDGDTLYVGPVSGTAASFATSERLKGGAGITAITWDRDNYLWAVQGEDIWVVPGIGTTKYPAQSDFAGPVTQLAIAPDGVRVAAIVQDGSGSELELAAIVRNVGGPERGQRGLSVLQYTILPGVQLGPNLTDPISLAWYNADTLIVLEAESGGNVLYLVPVDGEQATPLPVTPSGTISITADNAANILVAGLSGGGLAFSLSTAGPWKNLGDGGSSPAYP